MNEHIQTSVAALNATWQRYAQAEAERLDPAQAEALNREYVKAWEGLDACGIAEWMLVYDPITLTFSLPQTEEMAEEKTFATAPIPAGRNSFSRNRRGIVAAEQEQGQSRS
jgi:hypothetical protein